MLKRVFGSSVGKKYLMAVTGLVLLGFVIVHMVGNLQLFLGREALNRYAEFLKGLGELLWVARLVLLACVGLHIWAAIALTLSNRKAKPVGYQVPNPNAASYASRTMIYSGLIVLAFLLFHLAHFTLGLTHPEHYALIDEQSRHDVFGMVVKGFQSPWVSGFYILAMGLLFAHLSHGISAFCQSLGLRSPANHALIDRSARLISAALFIGNSVMPLSILLGYGKDLVR
ncbi:MAG: succinate dehydrogenase cytochrome b subunit [Acidobacteriota bacterium]